MRGRYDRVKTTARMVLERFQVAGERPAAPAADDGAGLPSGMARVFFVAIHVKDGRADPSLCVCVCVCRLQLLHGPSGCGKSMLVAALATALQLNIVVCQVRRPLPWHPS